ncbi:hypothetical protein NQZ68_013384 [Dissostichus eleginoides]|nr:hypothetical protein NQZ68_013384 [Dissostichus eleginoides]
MRKKATTVLTRQKETLRSSQPPLGKTQSSQPARDIVVREYPMHYVRRRSSLCFALRIPDGQLLNINRFRARGQTTTISIMELQYADDNALVALSE